ncbi:hypothetical protein K7432_006650 [Basidiobolus ranarum]|uniref:Uncharacterized protein n=1 Tax=Basidiobolus ranarum TaxID=34480 RepID=A0ABR2W1A5_9FUNG
MDSSFVSLLVAFGVVVASSAYYYFNFINNKPTVDHSKVQAALLEEVERENKKKATKKAKVTTLKAPAKANGAKANPKATGNAGKRSKATNGAKVVAPPTIVEKVEEIVEALEDEEEYGADVSVASSNPYAALEVNRSPALTERKEGKKSKGSKSKKQTSLATQPQVAASVLPTEVVPVVEAAPKVSDPIPVVKQEEPKVQAPVASSEKKSKKNKSNAAVVEDVPVAKVQEIAKETTVQPPVESFTPLKAEPQVSAKELDELRQVLNDKEEAIHHLTRQNESLKSLQNQIQKEFDEVSEKLNDQQMDKKSFENKLKTLETKADSLNYTNQVLFKQLSIEKENVKALQASSYDVEQVHSTHREQQANLQQQIEQLNHERKSIYAEQETLARQVRETQSREANLVNDLGKAKAVIDQLTHELGFGQQRMSQIVSQKDQAILAMENKIKSMEHATSNEFVNLREEYDQLSRNLSNVESTKESRIQELEKELARAREQSEQHLQLAKEAEHSKAELEAVKSQLEQAQAELSKAKSSLEEVRASGQTEQVNSEVDGAQEGKN